MTPRILILGAGFGGLELATSLSETMGDGIEVTLIDRAEGFTFGFAKLDVLFGRSAADAVRHPYARFSKPGVRLLRERVTEIDPERKQVTTDRGVHDADILVVALGADYDVSGTPGVVLGKNEFYSVAGAAHLATVLPGFKGGDVVVGMCGAPYKCPPAPSECALMLHDFLVASGVRGASRITIINPLPSPVPPSPETSKALLGAFAERGIAFVTNTKVVSVDEGARSVVLDNGTTIPCDLFLGVTKRCGGGRGDDGERLGHCRSAEAADEVRRRVRGGGSCCYGRAEGWGVRGRRGEDSGSEHYLAAAERGGDGEKPGLRFLLHRDGRRPDRQGEVDFFSGPKPVGTFYGVSEELMTDKKQFGSSRRARWFGM